ncbi:hypothetical protein [Serratia proteamaculans]
MKTIDMEGVARGKIWQMIFLLLCLLPCVGQADVVLGGKITSKVTGRVIKANNLIVTDEQGTWYGQGLKMDQLGGFETAYEVIAPLRITSSTGKFQVRMDNPLVLQHQSKPGLTFRDVVVKMGQLGEEQQLLEVAKNTSFTNPAATTEGEDSIGHYLLNVAAMPPEGEFKSVTGTYSGVLSLTFEPLVEK